MQAILIADYSFAPIEYWRGISHSARDFIKRCLTIDPTDRMTSHDALSHPWISNEKSAEGPEGGSGEDLLPVVKKNFNARRTLHAAIDTIRAINKLREGGVAGMNGGKKKEEEKVVGEGGDMMDIDSRGHGRGQTEEQIRVQEKKVAETTRGLWQSRAGG